MSHVVGLKPDILEILAHEDNQPRNNLTQPQIPDYQLQVLLAVK